MKHLIKNKLQEPKTKIKNLSTRLFHGKSLVLSQQTPYEVIATYHHAQVRFYASQNKKFKEPLVFVAPLAINMAIYDLYPYRSLIKYFSEQGFDVYLIDWGKLTYNHRNLNFLDFINHLIPFCIDQILKHSKSEQISLHGWSMAGIFVLLYTALRQPNFVKNLIILGSPIDSYKSGNIGKLYSKVNSYLKHSQTLKRTLYEGGIPRTFLHTPGLINAIGFKVLDLKGWYEGHKNLLKNLDDPQTLYEHATLGHFLNHMIDYPGGINQDMLFNVWLQNPLKTGKIRLGKTTIKLNNIDCSLLVGAGTSDQMVTANAVQPLVGLTNSQDVTFTLIPGGHLGLMSSQKSADEFWPELAQWLSKRSTSIN